jgi:hypothetical protein
MAKVREWVASRWLTVGALAFMAASSLPLVAQDTPDSGSFNQVTEAAMDNFFEIVRTFGNDLARDVTAAFNQAIPPQRTFKFMMGIIFATFMIDLFMTIYKVFGQFSTHSLVGNVSEFISEKAPRIMMFALAAMLTAGAAGIMLKPASGKPDWWFFQLTRSAGAGKVAKLIDRYNPVTEMEKAALNMTTNINGLNYTFLQSTVAAQLNQLSQTAQDTGVEGDSTSGVISGAMGMTNDMAKLWNATLQQAFNVGSHVTFFWAQFALAKGFLVNLTYFKIAWRLSVLMLPYLVLLGYFRSFNSYLINLVKHLIALSIAGFIMAGIANTLFTPEFWKGAIETAFAGVTLNSNEIQAFRGMPDFMQAYGAWVANAQLAFVLGLIGTLLDKMYDAVKSGMTGVGSIGARNLGADRSVLGSAKFDSQSNAKNL